MPANKFEKISLTFAVVLSLGVFSISYASELTEISISLVGNEVVDIDSSNKLVRAQIQIENYDPQDGYYFMRVVNLSTGQIFKESEFIPRYIGEQNWGTQIAYMIPDDTSDQIVGNYEIQVYSEFGSSESSVNFSVVSKDAPLWSLNPTNSTGLTGTTGFTGTTGTTGTTGITGTQINNALEEQSRLPEWVRNVFLWYGEEKISEGNLLAAIEFLIKQKIIHVNLE